MFENKIKLGNLNGKISVSTFYLVNFCEFNLFSGGLIKNNFSITFLRKNQY